MNQPPAAASADSEADQWIELVDMWRHPTDLLVVPREADVVRFFDPADDLRARMDQWGYAPGDLTLSDLALFSAGLAKAEADAWRLGNEHIATQAYSARRFLLGDRILHWAIPWLRAAEAVDPVPALLTQQFLLGLGQRHRPAPLLADGEGITAPGEDSYGPVDIDEPLHERLRSVWSGQVLAGSLDLQLRNRVKLAATYAEAAADWRVLAETYPGSARLWRDLGRRAARTAEELD